MNTFTNVTLAMAWYTENKDIVNPILGAIVGWILKKKKEQVKTAPGTTIINNGGIVYIEKP